MRDVDIFRELIDRGLLCVLTGLDIARIDAAPVITAPSSSKNSSRREGTTLAGKSFPLSHRPYDNTLRPRIFVVPALVLSVSLLLQVAENMRAHRYQHLPKSHTIMVDTVLHLVRRTRSITTTSGSFPRGKDVKFGIRTQS